MKVEKILKFLKKKLEADKDYAFIVIDMREDDEGAEPTLFNAWHVVTDKAA